MYKKLILLIVVSGLLLQCGFTPLYSVKDRNVNFSLNELNFEGDKIINNYLKNNLAQFTYTEYEKEFNLKVITKYNKATIAKDKAANITDYELSCKSIFQIFKNNKFFKEIVITKKQNMDNMSDKFEEQKYEKNIKQNFAASIANELSIKLSLIDDN